jgi:hypothetical protein
LGSITSLPPALPAPFVHYHDQRITIARGLECDAHELDGECLWINKNALWRGVSFLETQFTQSGNFVKLFFVFLLDF